MAQTCKPLPGCGASAPGAAPAVAAAAALLLAAAGKTPLATLLVLAPAAEEIVFRAGLQEALLRRGGALAAPALANLLTALAFAVAHVALRPAPMAALTLVPALACGHLYQRCRRVAPCIALHSMFNAAWLLGAARPVHFLMGTMP